METTPPTIRLLDGRELASLLRISPRNVLKMAKEKTIPAIRIGELYRFEAGEVITSLRNQSKKT